MFNRCFMDVSWGFQVYFQEVAKVFQESLKGGLKVVSKVFKQVASCFREISIVSRGDFKGFFRKCQESVSRKFSFVTTHPPGKVYFSAEAN